MSLFTCKVMRGVVITAGVLFLLGFVLQSARLLPADGYAALVTLLSGTGLAAMLSSLVIMVTAGIVVLMPSVSRSLDHCQH
jgi:hypothetical protein